MNQLKPYLCGITIKIKHMKTLFLTIALLICVNSFAREIRIESKRIQRFEVVNSRYYLVVEGTRYELHTKSQMKAVQSLIYKKETITINVK